MCGQIALSAGAGRLPSARGRIALSAGGRAECSKYRGQIALSTGGGDCPKYRGRADCSKYWGRLALSAGDGLP